MRRPLTEDESKAYRALARAAARLRKAQQEAGQQREIPGTPPRPDNRKRKRDRLPRRKPAR